MRGAVLLLSCLLAAGLAACGGESKSEKSSGGGSAKANEEQSPKVLQSWLTAAVKRDGKAYCQQMTLDVQEKATDAQSDQAKAKCQQAVKEEAKSDLPLLIRAAFTGATPDSVDVRIVSRIPNSVTLRQEDGVLKVDDAKGGEEGGGQVETQPSEEPTAKQGVTLVQQWLQAATNRDGKGYCGQMSVDLLESATGAQSDKAKARCEKLVKDGGKGLPLRFSVVIENADKTAADVRIDAQVPETVKLRKEGGKLKIDQVDGGGAEPDQGRKKKRRRK